MFSRGLRSYLPRGRYLVAFVVALLLVPSIVASAVLYGHSVTLVKVRDIDQELVTHLLVAQNRGDDEREATASIGAAFKTLANPWGRPKLGLVFFRDGSQVAANYDTPPGFDEAAATSLAESGDSRYQLRPIPGKRGESLFIMRVEQKYAVENDPIGLLRGPIRQWLDREEGNRDIEWSVVKEKAGWPALFTFFSILLLGALFSAVFGLVDSRHAKETERLQVEAAADRKRDAHELDLMRARIETVLAERSSIENHARESGASNADALERVNSSLARLEIERGEMERRHRQELAERDGELARRMTPDEYTRKIQAIHKDWGDAIDKQALDHEQMMKVGNEGHRRDVGRLSDQLREADQRRLGAVLRMVEHPGHLRVALHQDATSEVLDLAGCGVGLDRFENAVAVLARMTLEEVRRRYEMLDHDSETGVRHVKGTRIRVFIAIEKTELRVLCVCPESGSRGWHDNEKAVGARCDQRNRSWRAATLA